MRSLFIVLTLALALVACSGKKSSPTTPTVPTPHGPVTEKAMLDYFQARFPKAVAEGTLVLDFGSTGVANDVTSELHILGIDDMSGVAALVPNDFDTKGFNAIKASSGPTTTVAGLMRDLMIMHDTRGYFEKAWRNGWVTSGPQDFPAPAAYGVDFSIMEELGVFTGEGDDNPCGGNPCGGWEEDENPCGGNPCE
jgi:hypothetical protein